MFRFPLSTPHGFTPPSTPYLFVNEGKDVSLSHEHTI